MTSRLLLLFLSACVAATAAKQGASEVTFHRDVMPLLQKHCQSCHRPGEAAPMSLLNYKEVRPWAQAIKEAVVLKRMPPWFADPEHSKELLNDRSLTQQELDTLTAWVDAGSPEGDPADAPVPIEFYEGWNIGKPDVVVEMPQAFEVPAEGVIDYQYLVIPTGFTEDKWVRKAEIRPGNRAVVHHVIAFVRPPGSEYMAEAKPGKFFVPGKYDPEKNKDRDLRNEFIIGYAPGTVPEELEPGQAKFIEAGSDWVLQLHYTPTGKPESAQSSVGIIFAAEPPKERVKTLAVARHDFVIPPGAPNHQVDAALEIPNPMTLTAMLPHMHLRGKAFQYRVVFPDGRQETILTVPRYDFNWQLSYYLEEPIHLPKGAKLEATAWYDNSPNNPFNPDPAAEVRYGDQTFEEMMFGFFDASFPVEQKQKEDQSD